MGEVEGIIIQFGSTRGQPSGEPATNLSNQTNNGRSLQITPGNCSFNRGAEKLSRNFYIIFKATKKVLNSYTYLKK